MSPPITFATQHEVITERHPIFFVILIGCKQVTSSVYTQGNVITQRNGRQQLGNHRVQLKVCSAGQDEEICVAQHSDQSASGHHLQIT